MPPPLSKKLKSVQHARKSAVEDKVHPYRQKSKSKKAVQEFSKDKAAIGKKLGHVGKRLVRPPSSGAAIPHFGVRRPDGAGDERPNAFYAQTKVKDARKFSKMHVRSNYKTPHLLGPDAATLARAKARHLTHKQREENPRSRLRTEVEATKRGLPTSGKDLISPFFEEDSAEAQKAMASKEHALDNMEVVSSSASSRLHKWVGHIERWFPDEDKEEGAEDEEDHWYEDERFRERISYVIHRILFPSSEIFFHAIIGAIVAASAELGFSITWVLLAWTVLEGWELFKVCKKLASRAVGLPYYQYIDNAFVLHPKCETVAWLNVVIRGVWANCCRGFLRGSFKDCLNELIRRRLRERRHYLQYLYPRVTELDVGSHPPWITAVESYVSEVTLMDGSHDSFTVDLGIMCQLKCKIKVSLVHILEVGIKELQFNGPVRIRFLPLLRDEKVFGQLQISLLRPPKLQFETFGLLGMLSFPVIKPITLKLLKEICVFFHYPQKIIIPNPFVDAFKDHTVVPSRPLGLMRIHLKEGKNMRTQQNIGAFCGCVGRTDPYVIIRLGAQAEKTQVVRREASPTWDYAFEFPISEQDVKYREIKFYVLDFEWGFWTEDKPIGFTSVSVKRLVANRIYDHWYLLGDGGEGKLHISTAFVPVRTTLPKVIRLPVSVDQRKSQGILGFLAFEVQMNHHCKPMLVLEVSGRKPVTTTHGQLSENWEFAEEFFIPVNDVKRDKLTISLVDFDSKKSLKKATRKFCKTLQKFISESEDPQVVKHYNRGNHYLLGENVIDIDTGFTGKRQIINLHSDCGGIYKVIGAGRLYLLKII